LPGIWRIRLTISGLIIDFFSETDYNQSQKVTIQQVCAFTAQTVRK